MFGHSRLTPSSLVVCTASGFQMKGMLELGLSAPGGIPLVKALNKLQAMGYEFTHPPHGIAAGRNEKYFRIRVPRSFALAHFDSMQMSNWAILALEKSLEIGTTIPMRANTRQLFPANLGVITSTKFFKVLTKHCHQLPTGKVAELGTGQQACKT